MRRTFVVVGVVALTAVSAFAQTPRQQLARGQALWDQRLAKSAIAALEIAARDKATAAEAHEALGRLYTYKGWLQDNVMPGWHDEPSLRAKAIAELKASIAADPTRASAQEALRTAEGYAAADAVDPAPPRPEIRALDQRLQSYQTKTDAPIAEILDALEARAKAQADPAPYFVAAQILIDRGEYDRAISIAAQGAAASDKFIDENLSAYMLPGKSQGSYARGRSQAADLIGWALFLKKDYAGAKAKLEEAERLSQGADFANQFHLGELARTQNDTAQAREHYLNALSLAGGPAPLRQRATQALDAMQIAPVAAGGFEPWLESQLTRRREERKTAMLRSLIDRPLPKLALTTVDGRPYNTSSLRGKVLLLNFFASW
jgi:tetratricopeptide (TPR) repeat protein